MYGTPRLPTIDETMMRWPAPWRRKTGSAARVGVIGAEVVDVQQLPHLVGRHLVDRARDAEAGVADHDVEAAEALDPRAPTSPSMSALARHVGDHRQRLAAGRVDLRRNRVQPIGAPRADHDRRAVARQPQRRRAADAGGRAGDRDNTHLFRSLQLSATARAEARPTPDLRAEAAPNPPDQRVARTTDLTRRAHSTRPTDQRAEARPDHPTQRAEGATTYAT